MHWCVFEANVVAILQYFGCQVFVDPQEIAGTHNARLTCVSNDGVFCDVYDAMINLIVVPETWLHEIGGVRDGVLALSAPEFVVINVLQFYNREDVDSSDASSLLRVVSDASSSNPHPLICAPLYLLIFVCCVDPSPTLGREKLTAREDLALHAPTPDLEGMMHPYASIFTYSN